MLAFLAAAVAVPAHAGWTVFDEYALVEFWVPEVMTTSWPHARVLEARLEGTSILFRYEGGFTAPRQMTGATLKYWAKRQWGMKGATLVEQNCTTTPTRNGEIDVCMTGFTGKVDGTAQAWWLIQGHVVDAGNGTIVRITGDTEELKARSDLLHEVLIGWRRRGEAGPAELRPAPAAPAAPAPGAAAAAKREVPCELAAGNAEVMAECAARCDRGDWDGCTLAGLNAEDLAQLEEATRFHTRALEVSEAACAAGDGMACHGASERYLDGAGVPEHGEPSASATWGSTPPDGEMARWPWAAKARELERRALELLRQGCSSGDAAACYGVGTIVNPAGEDDDSTIEAFGAKLDAFKKACGLGHTEACSAFGATLTKMDGYGSDVYAAVCRDPARCTLSQ